MDYYGILHKLLDAICYEKGTKFKGLGTHQQLIDYVCKEKNFTTETKHFLQELREKRNTVCYEGNSIPEEYLEANEQTILALIRALEK